MLYSVVLFIAIFAFATVAIDTNAKKNSSVFVPTNEWQILEKGQPIPRGLHIKHDLTTGITQAKLMDTNESEDTSEDNENHSRTKSLTLHPEKSFSETDSAFNKQKITNQIKTPVDELKEMLEKIQSYKPELFKAAITTKPEKFRMHSELDAPNMNISTHSEKITSLFHLFEQHKESITTNNFDSSKISDILYILNNLEYLFHQIDNAQTFAAMGGMTKIISLTLNSTNPTIKAEALKLLGVAVQSNPKVQMKALENDYVQKMLHMLTIDNTVIVKSRCLFALGALVRQFPAAQKIFVDNGGIQIFGKILVDGHANVKIRVMTLINDLAIERKNLNEIEDEEQKLSRITDYNLTNFEQKLLSQKYCQNLVDLMLQSLHSFGNVDGFHYVLYENMNVLSTICKDEIMNKQDEIMHEAEKHINNISSEPIQDMDQKEADILFSHIWVLRNMRNIVINNQLHDEL